MDRKAIFPVILTILTISLQILTGSNALADSVIGWGGQKVFDTNKLKGLVAVSASDVHSLALKSDGSIVGWGRDHYGQASPPAGNDFVAISAGGGELPLRDCGHGLALKSDGSIVAWGINDGSSGDFGQVSDTPDSNDFIAISAGYNYNIALKSDGSLVSWGIDDGGWADCGQVSDTPDGNDFTAIAAGIWHNLAIRSDGSIVAWGDDHYGQASPPSGNDFIAIAAGASHSLALKSDGSIVAWGIDNGDEQFGDYGQVTDTPDGNDFVAIAAGVFHSLALKTDGSVVGWGGSTNWLSESMPSSGDYIAIAAGGAHNLALRPDGSVIGWGANWCSQAAPPAGDDYAAIAAGGWHGISLKSDGSIFGWGENLDPAMIPDGNDFIAVAAGYHHSLALRRDGSIIQWGEAPGQPPAPDGKNFTAISAGYMHNLAINSDGSVVIWGGSGQPTIRDGDCTAIAAGRAHSIALKSDGSIVGWGSEPPDGNDFVAISAGEFHSLALKSDGSIIGWGRDQHGQATPPDGNDFVAIAAGYYHSLALKTDGSIVGWEGNEWGQATPPTGNNFTAIAAGRVHSLALVAETNNKPVADAGQDQVVYACVDEIAEIRLDGSGSYDADGDELEYFWYENDEQIATGVDPNVELAIGEHTIDLIVNDGSEDSEPNSVVITVVGPVEADVHIVPRVINRRSRMKRVMAIIRLPEGIGKHDIADEPFVLEPGGIESRWDRVIGRGNQATVFALFDKNEVMDALSNDGGVELTVIGKLESGQCISGADTVRIVQPRRRRTRVLRRR